MTVKVPLTVAVQDRVDVPDPPVTEVGVSVHVIPVAGEEDDVSATVPVNPLTGATVIVEVPAWLVLTATLVGLAVSVKFWIVNVTVAV